MLAEIRTVRLEQRAGLAELRANLAEFRLDVSTRLTTLFDELAAFRAEYNQHTHE